MRDRDGRRRFLGWRLLALLLVLSPILRADDLVDRRIIKEGPWSLELLRQTPAVTDAREDGNVTALYYAGEPFQTKPTRVFAYLARPTSGGPRFPAMVLVHGGGGKAFREWAELWASRGYVALAMDLAGRGPDGQRLPDGSPDQNDQAKFQAETIGSYWSYHAVANVIRGVSLLAGRPDVDPDRIGVTGISWGGYLTCIVAGLDDRLRVAVPVYGCGFLHENSAWIPRFEKMSPEDRTRWVEHFDPSRYLGQADMPMLFVNGTNDFAYPLDSYRKSYQLVADHQLCVTVNMPHSHPAGWKPVEIGIFVDSILKDGVPLPVLGVSSRMDGTVTIPVASKTKLTAAQLHYTTDTGPWQKRQWTSKPAMLESDMVRATVPSERPVVYFLTVTDERNATVSSEHEVLEP